MKTQSKIGEIVKERWIKKGLNQAELAELSKINQDFKIKGSDTVLKRTSCVSHAPP